MGCAAGAGGRARGGASSRSGVAVGIAGRKTETKFVINTGKNAIDSMEKLDMRLVHIRNIILLAGKTDHPLFPRPPLLPDFLAILFG